MNDNDIVSALSNAVRRRSDGMVTLWKNKSGVHRIRLKDGVLQHLFHKQVVVSYPDNVAWRRTFVIMVKMACLMEREHAQKRKERMEKQRLKAYTARVH